MATLLEHEGDFRNRAGVGGPLCIRKKHIVQGLAYGGLRCELCYKHGIILEISSLGNIMVV